MFIPCEPTNARCLLDGGSFVVYPAHDSILTIIPEAEYYRDKVAFIPVPLNPHDILPCYLYRYYFINDTLYEVVYFGGC